MNSIDIERALVDYRPTFIGIYSIDGLPDIVSDGSVMICNTDPEHLPGRHWIALYVNERDGGEYFDSFGQEPLRPFVDYMNKRGRWTFSERQIQSVASSFCGQYCIYYTKLRCSGVDLSRIINTFTRDTGYNDLIVHKFVCGNKIK
jgi:hypothetical protein